MLHLSAVLAAVLLVLGLVDYGLRYSRFEAMLRMTPQEQREDQRTMEGDVAVRAQRRRIARAWRGDAPDLLAGASLVLTGPGGLTLVLSGGPPPRRSRDPDDRQRGSRAKPEAHPPRPRESLRSRPVPWLADWRVTTPRARPSPPSRSPNSPRSGRLSPRLEALGHRFRACRAGRKGVAGPPASGYT